MRKQIVSREIIRISLEYTRPGDDPLRVLGPFRFKLKAGPDGDAVLIEHLPRLAEFVNNVLARARQRGLLDEKPSAKVGFSPAPDSAQAAAADKAAADAISANRVSRV